MISINDIEYLALEGGGGKGVAYLGAIEVLEEQGLIPFGAKYSSKIKGISGSSAGAITALLLSIGLNTEEIKEELKPENNNFSDFFDIPHSGIYKAVFPNPKNPSVALPGYTVDKIIPDKNKGKGTIQVGYYFDTSLDKSNDINLKAKKLFNDRRNFFRDFLVAILPVRKTIAKSKNPILMAVSKNDNFLTEYIYNILHDRGIFPGITVRNYFITILAKHLPKKYPTHFSNLNAQEIIEKCQLLTFSDLFQITKVDLKVVSTNNTLGKPVFFSLNRTPNFPIIEAVSMSMAIPGVFKPIFNGYNLFTAKDTADPVVKRTNEDYIGFFVDGGTINNFPLHAFDDNADCNLNPNVLGIRLTSGSDPKKQKTWHNELENKYNSKGLEKIFAEKGLKPEIKNKWTPSGDTNSFIGKNIKTYSVEYPQEMDGFLKSNIGSWISKILSSLMYYSEDGQIRMPEEKEQVLELYSYTIDTLNFSPDEAEKEYVIEQAKNTTLDFFNLPKNEKKK